MKKRSKFHDPVRYRLTADDLAKTNGYSSLLNRLTDIPASDPLHPIAITKAGIYHQQVMVHIADFEQAKRYMPVLCDVSLFVDLHQKRGIHMSRSVQAIFDLAAKRFTHLDQFAAELAHTARKRQGSQIGIAKVTGTYIHKTTTKKTHLASFNRLYLLSNASATSQETRIETGMKVYNLTACPCTRAYTKFAIVPELRSMGLDVGQINRILEVTLSGTHTQRGTTTLLLDKEDAMISHKDIYSVLEKSVHLVNELLKRPDEHELIIRALTKPQFTEDVVREVAFNAYQQFKTVLSSAAELYAESMLQDSIHIHDVQTVINKTIGEIKNEVAAFANL
jgi:GTP cyclohydrolase-4